MTYLFHTLVLLCFLMTSAFAKTEEETPPWYQIELIIFEYTDTNNTDTETWEDDPGAPDTSGAIELIPPAALENYRALTHLPQASRNITPDIKNQSLMETEAETAIDTASITPTLDATIEQQNQKKAITDTHSPANLLSTQEETPFMLLPIEALTLNIAAKDLKRAKQYHVLHHIAWRQPALPPADSLSIRIHSDMEDSELFLRKIREQLSHERLADQTMVSDIQTGDSSTTPLLAENLPPETTTKGIEINQPLSQQFQPLSNDSVAENEALPNSKMSGTLINAQRLPLDGLVRISLSRYLHLSVDLTLAREVSLPIQPLFLSPTEDIIDEDLIVVRENPESALPTAPEPNIAAMEVIETTLIKPFRLIESRRMRSKEVHYLDHPAFGVIALITPYERPSSEQEEDSTSIEDIMIDAPR